MEDINIKSEDMIMNETASTSESYTNPDISAQVVDSSNVANLNKFIAPRKTRTIIREHKEKIGRNDPCPCGSGKKYKNCCLKEGNDWNSTRELTAQEMVKCKHGTSQPQDFKK